MDDLAPLRADVARFRRALDTCHPDLGPVFRNFPRRCCGAAAELLAAYLKDRDHGVFAYVCGSRYVDGIRFTHAWLEGDGVLLDVTGDQFDGDAGPPLVSEDPGWHHGRFPDLQRGPEDADFREACGTSAAELWGCYARIREEIETGEDRP